MGHARIVRPYGRSPVRRRGGSVLSWPRGRYNGHLVDGGTIKVELHLLWWEWWPNLSWNHGQPYVHWLCVTVRAEPHYDWHHDPRHDRDL